MPSRKRKRPQDAEKDNQARLRFAAPFQIFGSHEGHVALDLVTRERHKRNQRDVEIINNNAARLNHEAKDTLEYQKIR